MLSPKGYNEGVETISARIPASVMRQVRIILLDPTLGQIGYGRLSNLITSLLTEWLEERKKEIETVSSLPSQKDKFESFDNEGK